jgi:hypothetical protein
MRKALSDKNRLGYFTKKLFTDPEITRIADCWQSNPPPPAFVAVIDCNPAVASVTE